MVVDKPVVIGSPVLTEAGTAVLSVCAPQAVSATSRAASSAARRVYFFSVVTFPFSFVLAGQRASGHDQRFHNRKHLRFRQTMKYAVVVNTLPVQ